MIDINFVETKKQSSSNYINLGLKVDISNTAEPKDGFFVVNTGYTKAEIMKALAQRLSTHPEVKQIRAIRMFDGTVNIPYSNSLQKLVKDGLDNYSLSFGVVPVGDLTNEDGTVTKRDGQYKIAICGYCKK